MHMVRGRQIFWRRGASKAAVEVWSLPVSASPGNLVADQATISVNEPPLLPSHPYFSTVRRSKRGITL